MNQGAVTAVLAVSAAVLLSVTQASAQLVQGSMSETLTGGAGNSNYGGDTYNQTSTTFNSTPAFDLAWPGYQPGLPTLSSGNAGWTSTPTSIQYADAASETTTPTPSFTQYASIGAMDSSFVDNFQVAQSSDMTLTAVQGGAGSVLDNNVVVYSWNGSSVLSTPIVLNAGDDLSVKYSVYYQTLYQGTAPTFSDEYSSSSELDVSPVPEPASVLLLALGSVATLCRRARRAG
jgi:hypothetical protein